MKQIQLDYFVNNRPNRLLFLTLEELLYEKLGQRTPRKRKIVSLPLAKLVGVCHYSMNNLELEEKRPELNLFVIRWKTRQARH